MTRAFAILEGAVLALLGGFMLHLVRSGNYWYFLNPRFEPLTVAAGVGLVVLGLALPFVPARELKPTRLVVFLLFIPLALWADFAAEEQYTVEPYGLEEAESPEPRIELDGREYVKMNTAELFMLLSSESPEVPKLIALRGMVKRSPELDAQGRFALVRMAIVCCLADAVAPGFAVESNSLPEDGAWVRVLGSLKPAVLGRAEVDSVHVQGTVSTLINDKFVIIPRLSEPIKQPELPFIFEFKREEPFAY